MYIYICICIYIYLIADRHCAERNIAEYSDALTGCISFDFQVQCVNVYTQPNQQGDQNPTGKKVIIPASRAGLPREVIFGILWGFAVWGL